MKKKNLYFLIVGIFILFCPALTFAFQKSDCIVIDDKLISTISQDNSILFDFDISDLNTENSEVPFMVFRQEIFIPAKTLNCSKFICFYSLNKNIQNQINIPVPLEIKSDNQKSKLFTGVLLI